MFMCTCLLYVHIFYWSTESHSVFDYQAILALLKIPMVRYIVILKVVVGIPVGVFHSMFAMVNIDKFGLTAETNGHLLSYVGIVTMVSRLISI